MTSSFVLSPLSAKEAETLAKLSKEAFQEPYDPPWTADEFRQRLLMNSSERLPLFGGWLARQGGTPAGFVFVQIFDRVVDIQKIATHPSFQRRGVATCLLKQCTQAFPQHTLELEVATCNRAALALYTTLGFHNIATRPRTYVAGQACVDAYILRRITK